MNRLHIDAIRTAPGRRSRGQRMGMGTVVGT